MKKLTKSFILVLIFSVLFASAAQAASLGSRTLKNGISGTDVTELQQLLKRIGFFSGTATGYYGSVTENYVKSFQSAYGLSKDGIAGTETIFKVKYENGIADQSFVYYRLLKTGIRGGDVMNLQVVLKRLGFIPGNAALNSYFGNDMVNAVKAFQKAAGISADGIVGPATAAAINSSLSKPGSGAGTPPGNSGSTGLTYTVQPGDTLWILSQRYMVTVDQIQRANNLTGTNLWIGQKLVIPVQGGMPDRGDVDRNPSPSITYKNYTVKAGDTIWSIANAFNIPQNDLMKANNFSSGTVLYIGQNVKIPVHNVPVKPTPGSQYGELLDWWTEAQYVLPFNVTFTVTDFYTGTSFKAVRTFGANHADCEPATAQDTAAIRSLWNKYHTSYWSSRPVIITINGRRLAASMSAMFHAGLDSAPNGAYVNNRSGDYGYGQNFDAIKGNGADGHFDIHFLNSTTHVDGSMNSGHQSNVRISAGVK